MKEKMKNNKGITLVALVVTIVIILILSTITINAAIGKNGLIEKAKEAKLKGERLESDSDARMNDILAEYNNAMAEDGSGGTSGDTTNSTGGGTTEPEKPDVPKGPNGNQLVSSVVDTEHDTIHGEDSLGNPVVIPGGFKFATDSGKTVEEGIVVEDNEGNQFVWIPVSNIDGDGTGKIVKRDGTEVEITLGRYTFDTSTGQATIQQKGSEYATTVTIDSYFQERTGDAKDLYGFVTSVKNNHGFFFARYEACYGSGSSYGVGLNENYIKPASKPSTSCKFTTELTDGALLIKIEFAQAVSASRQMYYSHEFVDCDLVNSYMWDTALVYIQSMGYNSYPIQGSLNTSVSNSGTGDLKCNIYDMASNLQEFTTEYSSHYRMGSNFAYTSRGGFLLYTSPDISNTKKGASFRGCSLGSIGTSSAGIGFRVGLWIK